MRSVTSLAVAAVMLLGVACAEVEPQPTAPIPPAQTIRVDGLALTALANQWSAFPPDLERYYVPIEVVIVNDRAEPIALRLEDFTLLDASGRERAAVPPREATTALFGSYGRRGAAAEGPRERAAGDGVMRGVAVAPASSSFFFSGRFGYPFSHPSYYPYYGYPYYGPPAYYYPYGTYRPPTYGELTGDLIRLGLREERIEPHAAVRGFLYFSGAQGKPEGLRLRWSPPAPIPAPLIAPVASTEAG